MNIEQSKSILIQDVIAKQGLAGNFAYEKKQGKELWYHSPFRDEDTPSFKINTEKNTFWDFGTNKGGDTLNYVCQFYNEDVRGGLQQLKQIFGGNIPKNPKRPPSAKPRGQKSRFEVKKAKRIIEPELFRFLDSRGINRKIGLNFLKQVHYYDNQLKKEWFGVGMENRAGGWEVKNKYYNTAIGKKDITMLMGKHGSNFALHVFEGITDALTLLSICYPEVPHGDIMILNTAALTKEGISYAKYREYPKIILWLDNDETGLNATQEFLSIPYATVTSMNHLYQGHKDLNEWHMHNIEHGRPSLLIEEEETPDESIGWKGNRATPEATEAFKKSRENKQRKQSRLPFGISGSDGASPLNGYSNRYKPKQ